MPQINIEVRSGIATHEDLRRILGHIDDRKAIEILALHPKVLEVEEAAVWAAGDGDVLAKGGRPLTGVAAEIFEMLTADEDEEEPPPVS
jgi:hypothetical protein